MSKKPFIQSLTLQLNCSRLFYNLLSVSLRASGTQSCPGIESTRVKTQKGTCENPPRRTDGVFCASLCPQPCRCANEWMWRSGVDKIRGERQDGRKHDERWEKRQTSHSDGVSKHQRTRGGSAPSAGCV